MKTFIKIVLAGLIGVYEAFAFSKIWEWFIVPLGASQINIVHALGILLMVSFIKRNDAPDRSVFTVLTEYAIKYSAILLTGYIVKGFI